MYSVVLMAALTAGTSAPTWGWGCHGCNGGGGGHGCHGWGGHGCHGCHGGWGSCNGYGGGWTSCYGCYGGYSGGCYGGCSGSCYGGYACSGCYGSYGYGCYGAAGYGCCGGMMSGTVEMAPAQMGTPTAPSGGATTPEPVPPPKKEKTTSLDQAARLIVELPADAKLYVDDKPTKTTSERRVFNTPQLEPGQTYYYILRAETVRNGQTQAETKRVLLHSGEVVQASFRDLGTLAVAQTQAGGGQ